MVKKKLKPLTWKLFAIIKLFKSHSITLWVGGRSWVLVKFRNFFAPFSDFCGRNIFESEGRGWVGMLQLAGWWVLENPFECSWLHPTMSTDSHKKCDLYDECLLFRKHLCDAVTFLGAHKTAICSRHLFTPVIHLKRRHLRNFNAVARVNGWFKQLGGNSKGFLNFIVSS